jgi:uncharacterized membrane protein
MRLTMTHDWAIGLGWVGFLFDPFFATILMIIWAVLIVVVINSLNDASDFPGVRQRTARDILDEHLTKGEINREDYIDRRKALDFSAEII